MGEERLPTGRGLDQQTPNVRSEDSESSEGHSPDQHAHASVSAEHMAGGPPEEQQDVRAAGRRRLPVLTAVGGVVVGIVIGLVIIPAITNAAHSLGPTSIEAALDSCDVVPGSFFSLGDEGTSLSISTGGEDSVGASLSDVACVLAALDVPDSVITRIDSTRALDGRQEASWDDLDASWGYHPDSGLDLVVELHRD